MRADVYWFGLLFFTLIVASCTITDVNGQPRLGGKGRQLLRFSFVLSLFLSSLFFFHLIQTLSSPKSIRCLPRAWAVWGLGTSAKTETVQGTRAPCQRPGYAWADALTREKRVHTL
jgi:hypothetical protein